MNTEQIRNYLRELAILPVEIIVGPLVILEIDGNRATVIVVGRTERIVTRGIVDVSRPHAVERLP